MTSHMNILVQLLCFSAAVTVIHCKQNPKKIGEYFNLCSRSPAKDLNECVKNAVMAAKPTLIKGIPALNVFTIDPLFIPRMRLVEGSGNFLLDTTLTNLTFKGLKEFEVISSDFTFDDKNLKMDLEFRTPEINITAEYDMAGQILVVPIKGKGNCEMNFTDVTTILHSRGRVVERDNKKFIDLFELRWAIEVHGKARFWFYNLFNGDKLLGDNTNNFLNENSKEAFQSVKHLPEEGLAQVTKVLARNIFNHYPITEIFKM